MVGNWLQRFSSAKWKDCQTIKSNSSHHLSFSHFIYKNKNFSFQKQQKKRFSTTLEYGTNYKPTLIKYQSSSRSLIIEFEDKNKFTYPAEYLRVFSPSAEVSGHSSPFTTNKDNVNLIEYNPYRLIVNRKFVGILNIERVGNYAIQLEFDDRHNTGIYSWDYLHDLGVNKIRNIRAYLRALKLNNKTRNPKLKKPLNK